MDADILAKQIKKTLSRHFPLLLYIVRQKCGAIEHTINWIGKNLSALSSSICSLPLSRSTSKLSATLCVCTLQIMQVVHMLQVKLAFKWANMKRGCASSGLDSIQTLNSEKNVCVLFANREKTEQVERALGLDAVYYPIFYVIC